MGGEQLSLDRPLLASALPKKGACQSITHVREAPASHSGHVDRLDGVVAVGHHEADMDDAEPGGVWRTSIRHRLRSWMRARTTFLAPPDFYPT
jgi:hypothetical protein